MLYINFYCRHVELVGVHHIHDHSGPLFVCLLLACMVARGFVG